MPTTVVSPVAVLVAAVVTMVIGGLWYSPILFGKQWIRLSGMSMEKVQSAKQRGMAVSYALMFVGALVMSYILAHVVWFTHATTFGTGMQMGFWMWFGFISPVLLGPVLWEGKSLGLYVLNSAYYLVVIMVMGVILALWN